MNIHEQVLHNEDIIPYNWNDLTLNLRNENITRLMEYDGILGKFPHEDKEECTSSL